MSVKSVSYSVRLLWIVQGFSAGARRGSLFEPVSRFVEGWQALVEEASVVLFYIVLLMHFLVEMQ